MGKALSQQLTEVWERLDLVMDPELDEPVTDMGFIETVSVTGSNVNIGFRLPTFWCSPNFAFLMAEGIKQQVESLAWVGQAVVTLHDHMAAAEMNVAINAGHTFGSVFAELHPDEDLTALREKFDVKAFQRRQEVVIKGLIAQGYVADVIVSLTLTDLSLIRFDDPEVIRQLRRYTTLLTSKNLGGRADDLAFPTYQGTPIEDFQTYMGLLRSVRINMEFSGSLCRGLKASRYQTADLSGEFPILVTQTPESTLCS